MSYNTAKNINTYLKRCEKMKEIKATEQIFSSLSHGKPIAIRYHYTDGSYADAPASRKTELEDLPQALQDTIKAFEEKKGSS